MLDFDCLVILLVEKLVICVLSLVARACIKNEGFLFFRGSKFLILQILVNEKNLL